MLHVQVSASGYAPQSRPDGCCRDAGVEWPTDSCKSGMDHEDNLDADDSYSALHIFKYDPLSLLHGGEFFAKVSSAPALR